MTRTRVSTILSGLLALVALLVLLQGCSGGDDTTTTTALPPQETATTIAAGETTTGSTVPVAIDELSTFQSKDPFRQQALPPTTATTKAGSSSTTSTTAHSSTTSTTAHSSSTTTTHPSDVTTPQHSLKVLSIDEVNGEAVVTFTVDGVTYQDKHEGDVVSTSWGQIEVIEIDAGSQTVVFLHGSETVTLAVGQQIVK
jgi:hypothetical protein